MKLSLLIIGENNATFSELKLTINITVLLV